MLLIILYLAQLVFPFALIYVIYIVGRPILRKAKGLPPAPADHPTHAKRRILMVTALIVIIAPPLFIYMIFREF